MPVTLGCLCVTGLPASGPAFAAYSMRISPGRSPSRLWEALLPVAVVFVALFRNLPGLLDSVGRQKLQAKLPGAILSRIIEYEGQPAFRLAGSEDGNDENVLLTQRDIRQMQLAKAAIRAGIILLEKKMRIEDSDIKHILLAGAFGNYIRKESALRIGLAPDVPAERIVFVGNAASSGAQMVLLSRQSREQARELAQRIKYVEIAHQPGFTDVYVDSMLF